MRLFPVLKFRDDAEDMILFYFPPKHFAMTIKRDGDGNKKHKMLSPKKEKENGKVSANVRQISLKQDVVAKDKEGIWICLSS